MFNFCNSSNDYLSLFESFSTKFKRIDNVSVFYFNILQIQLTFQKEFLFHFVPEQNYFRIFNVFSRYFTEVVVTVSFMFMRLVQLTGSTFVDPIVVLKAF